MKIIQAAVMLTACFLVAGATAAAGAPPHQDCTTSCREVTGQGEKGTVEILGREASSDRIPGRGGPARSGSAPGRNEYEIVEEALAPACRENQRGDDALCTAALTCPVPEQTR